MKRLSVIGMTLVACFLVGNLAMAGTVYQVTAQDKNGKTVTYKVTFGGGRAFEMYTAFCPEKKDFVYLRFNRRGERPKSAGMIYDHRTGETIKLYQFEGCKTPLPVIESMQAMKVCPMTGAKDFESKAIIAID